MAGLDVGGREERRESVPSKRRRAEYDLHGEKTEGIRVDLYAQRSGH